MEHHWILQTIYDNAGVTLDVEEDDVVNVGTRSGVSCIRDAEFSHPISANHDAHWQDIGPIAYRDWTV